MDRAYKEDLPKYREALESLRSDFSAQASRTDWAGLRIQPLLDHVESLHRLLKSPKFAREVSRLRKGVAMFHADLIYLRANIKALKQILADEKRKSVREKTKRPNFSVEPTGAGFAVSRLWEWSGRRSSVEGQKGGCVALEAG